MKILDEIKTELQALQIDFGVSRITDNVFQVPEEFFNTFPDSMVEMITAINTEAVLGISAQIDNPYLVPDNYFEQLPDLVLHKVNDFDAIVQKGQISWLDRDKTNPFALPEHYFSSFETTLFENIFEPEENVALGTETLSPLLASLKDQQPFEVPTGYFDAKTLAEKSKKAENRITEHPAVRSIKWARWAAAAAVVFILGIGGMQFLGNTGVTHQDSLEQSLAKIPDEAVREWLSRNMYEQGMNMAGNSGTQAVNVSLQNFSEKEIEDYLATDVW